MKKIELLHFTVAKKWQLLDARINWIRANYKICVEQLICCQKCRANACRAIAIWAVHPHSTNVLQSAFFFQKGSKTILRLQSNKSSTIIKSKLEGKWQAKSFHKQVGGREGGSCIYCAKQNRCLPIIIKLFFMTL